MARASRDSERGSILVLTGLVLVVLLGMTALAVDVGYLFDVRQKMQSAADAAARAGGLELARGIADTCTGTGNCGLRPFVEHEAGVHGFTHGQNGVTVTINHPPTQSVNGFNGKAKYVEVIISRSTSTFFMRLFNRSTMSAEAKAVAGSGDGDLLNIIVLNPSGTQTFKTNGDIIAQGGIEVKSDGSPAFKINTGNTVTAGTYWLAEPVWGSSSNGCAPTNCLPYANVHFNTPQAQIVDPFAGQTAPSCALPCATYTGAAANKAASCDAAGCTINGVATGQHVLSPGNYPNGIDLSGGSTILSGGVYVLGNGISPAFKISGATAAVYSCGATGAPTGAGYTCTGSGVTLYYAGTAKVMSVASGATAVLVAPTSGGSSGGATGNEARLVWAPNSTNGAAIDVSSGTFTSFTGVIYVPNGTISFTGGPAGSNPPYTVMVGWEMILGGGGTLNFGTDTSLLDHGPPTGGASSTVSLGE